MFTAQMAEDWRSLDLPVEEQAMLDYVEKIALVAATITPDDLDRLRAVGWKDREILDIVLVAGHYSLRCRVADALGVDLDEGSIDAGLSEELNRRKVAVRRYPAQS